MRINMAQTQAKIKNNPPDPKGHGGKFFISRGSC